MEKELTIIIISYNTCKLTLDCIASIKKHTKGLDYEIIVVDNASYDESVTELKKLKEIKLIVNQHNVGYAAANNQGVEIAKGKYILLLNSDTLMTSSILAPILTYMDKHAAVGILSCGLRNKDGSMQETGGYFPTILRVADWMSMADKIPILSELVLPYHPKISYYKELRDLDWVTGAFFLTRKAVWDKIGMLDKKYFMYVEEVDFCYRAKQAGWKVYYHPHWSIIHFGKASSSSAYAIVSEFRGLLIFYKKHFPRWQYPLLRLCLKFGAGLRLFLKPSQAKTYREAWHAA